MPHSVQIERSGLYGFLDLPYIESVHFSKWSCPSGITDGVNPASGSNESTASVSFEVDPTKREECAKAGTDALTFYNTRAACGKEIVGDEMVIGLEWEPRCIYVVMSTDNQAQLFDEMMVRERHSTPVLDYSRSNCVPCAQAMGRIMSDPINVSVSYTVSLGSVPDVTSSAINCQSSFVLQEAYARDKILQDELQELSEQRSLYSMYTELIAFWEHVLKMSELYATYKIFYVPRLFAVLVFHAGVARVAGKFKLPPEPPPPPPPLPPPVGGEYPPAPPFPPQLVTFDQQTDQFRRLQAQIAIRVTELEKLVAVCTTTRTHVCGLPKNEVRCAHAITRSINR
jgi:hypothetical protein